MKKIFALFSVALLLPAVSFAQFTVDARLDGDVVRVDVGVPAGHYLYAADFKVTDSKGHAMEPLELPATATITDPNSGKPKPVFNASFKAAYAWKPTAGGAAAFKVEYWGCNDQVCFIPQTKTVELEAVDVEPIDEASAVDTPGVEPVAEPAEEAVAGWKTELENFEVRGSEVGYLKVKPFLRFLNAAENRGDAETVSGFHLFLTDPVAFVRESGLVWTIIFILVGGLALNLTPCVLPMIPINLAIIGAGAQAGSKGRGFALGGVYGLGIALAYGLLGVAVVLTGSQFGTIQSNPWFNLVIAIIFVVLALAMFDVFQIDFSRFQSKLGGGQHKQGSFLVAFSMGSVAALLAGACVAPVVIAVLALATNVYEANAVAGLALPFVLGLGMALPWPFAGAGLSFLPQPGKWMEYVKYGFGIGIIFFALYYGNLSYRAFRPVEISGQGEEKGHLIIDGSTNEGLEKALAQAHAEGKPVFIDFWASWCKNCKAMDKSTFKDEVVRERLAGYVFIKYIAEKADDPETRAVSEYFEVQGLPTFVVLAPKIQ